MQEPDNLRELLRLLLTRNQQLQTALDTRIVVEQAKGILAERYGLDPEEAFEAIRRASRANRMKLHDLVAKIRPSADTPPELMPHLDV